MQRGIERARSAASLLATSGALVLGIGLGALAGERLGAIAWPIAGVGLVAHLWGMVAARRIRQGEGYHFARWEAGAYWVCWLLIALGVAAALVRVLA